MIVDLMRNDLARVCEAAKRPRRPTLRHRSLPARVASGVVGAWPAPRWPLAGRSASGGVSRRLDHRGPEDPRDGNHRRTGAHRPRRLLRLAGLSRLRRLDGSEHPDPHDHRRPRLVAVSRRRWHRGRFRSPSRNTKKPGTRPKECSGRCRAGTFSRCACPPAWDVAKTRRASPPAKRCCITYSMVNQELRSAESTRRRSSECRIAPGAASDGCAEAIA